MVRLVKSKKKSAKYKMDTQKQQILETLQKATNVLVTVSSSPSVDQLSAAIGITLVLNKMGKHGTAVFSGEVPAVMDFLDPEKTLEKDTNSLRDFIISLDKSKADKLRYKVEDDHVKIFITPYRTSISDKDLVFSQGDFNVDVVLTLGVNEQTDLDKVIAANGRILHDAAIISVHNTQAAGLGSINWVKTTASSLSEMMVLLGYELKSDAIDEQTANAFLTGIVSETDRFSNDKTTSETLEVSSKLLAAGGNQQLVAQKLQPVPLDPVPQHTDPASDGALAVSKEPEVSVSQPSQSVVMVDAEKIEQESPDGSLTVDHTQSSEPEVKEVDQIDIDEQGQIKYAQMLESPHVSPVSPQSVATSALDSDASPTRLVTEPPTMGGTLTASGISNNYEGSSDPMSNVTAGQILNRPKQPDSTPASPLPDLQDLVDQEQARASMSPTATLEELERSVDSPHVANLPTDRLEPIAALNAEHVELGLGDHGLKADGNIGSIELPSVSTSQTDAIQADPSAPPTVPPPMMPPTL
ncbi:hypothetical protein KA068_01875 [Candidatus Saccharibacteria bacterium]|nr:hypothetical protein [Candidatus Saccharibacteria bacterium]